MTLTWEETRQIIADLEALYTDKSEMIEVEEIRGLQNEMDGVRAQQSSNAKAIIKEMTARVAQHEKEIDPPSRLAFEEKKSEVVEEKREMEGRIAALSEKALRTEGAIQELGANIKEASAALESTVTQHVTEMPRVQNALSLYANISGIKWNYDAPPDILAGWMAVPGSQTVLAFSFDTVQEECFDIANKLWDLIDASTAPPVTTMTTNMY